MQFVSTVGKAHLFERIITPSIAPVDERTIPHEATNRQAIFQTQVQSKCIKANRSKVTCIPHQISDIKGALVFVAYITLLWLQGPDSTWRGLANDETLLCNQNAAV